MKNIGNKFINKHFFLKKIQHRIYSLLGLMYAGEYYILKTLGHEDSFFFQKYNKLWKISFFSSKIFLKINDQLQKNNYNHIKNNNFIKIAFITYTGSMWSTDSLYKMLSHNKNIMVDIIVGKYRKCSPESRNSTFESTVSFFSNKGYPIIVNPSEKEMQKYDILFYLVPFKLYDKKMWIENIPMTTLLCYTSYSYMLADKPEKVEIPAYYCTWKYFCDSLFYLNLIKKSTRFVLNNMVYCGYSKMDEMYNNQKKENKRTSPAVLQKKIIIYAPHHSVNYISKKSATFDWNHRIILNLAKKYKDSTYWYYKPHPLLRAHTVEAGIFESDSDYEQYENQWKQLPNADVVTNGEYISLFKESNAMITDSVSFLAEYQFTGNPLLLLESGLMTYNEFGNRIINVLYRCKGDDISVINDFIEMIIANKDPMIAIRKEFFDLNLNYYKKNGKLASEYMYDTIISLFN